MVVSMSFLNTNERKQSSTSLSLLKFIENYGFLGKRMEFRIWEVKVYFEDGKNNMIVFKLCGI